MTWVLIVLVVIASFIKIIVTCPPTSLVEWLLQKFEIHPNLQSNKITITYDGKSVEGEKKLNFVKYFNEATFLEKYYIFPGNEKLFLQPNNHILPIVVDTKKGKKDMKMFVYKYEKHVDVVKQYKKKVVAYSIRMNHLQEVI